MIVLLIRTCILLLILTTASFQSFARLNLDSLTKALDLAIQNKQEYLLQKEQRIGSIRTSATVFTAYNYNRVLYHEYRKFKVDSALYYVQQNKALAIGSGNRQQLYESELQLANLFAFTGRYLEAEHILSSVPRKILSDTLLPAYYEACLRLFEHLGTNGPPDLYKSTIVLYRDSLLYSLDSTTAHYRMLAAERDIVRGNPGKAEKALLSLLLEVSEQDYDFAMIAYLLGNIYRDRKDTEKERWYYTISAIADTRNVIRDQASILNLSLIWFKAGDINRAYNYTRSAIEDAIAGHMQFRTLQLSQSFTVINAAYQDRELRSKKQLKSFLWAISLLSVLLILTLVYLYRQMEKLKRLRAELTTGSRQLAELNRNITSSNSQLSETNTRLLEANLVKEEYIAHFFDLCSAYINKLENYRKTLHQKASSRKMDELVEMLRSNSWVEDELEELYRNFDSVFLHLYPGFVQEFNALLLPEEQIILKHGELLNTELRIFALIRLGISDSVKIAAFLRYSLSTIYNYRTKTRNKAVVSRDEFESRVMKIGLNAYKIVPER